MFKRKKSKKKLFQLFIFLPLIAFFIAVGFNLASKKACSHFDCISFKGKEMFVLEDTFYQNDQNFLAQYRNDNHVLRVEIVDFTDLDTAKNVLKSRVSRILAQFETGISPYPGEISDSIVCPSEFKPKVAETMLNGISVITFEGLLNSRMSLGECQMDLIEYTSQNYYFICEESKKLFFLEFIQELDQDPFTLESIRCS